MAATADREAERSDGIIKSYKVAGATTIYKDTLVCDNTSGYAVPCDDVSGYVLLGVAIEKCDNSSGSDGDKSVRVIKTGEFKFKKASAAQTDIGVLMYCTSDEDVATSSTNNVKAGYCTEIVDSSNIRIRIDNVVQ